VLASDILEVIYAPHKAFKKITKSPSYIGPALIMGLFVLANVGLAYVTLSRSYLDQTAPPSSELDKWTEDTVFWNSSGTVAPNTDDCINGTYYGNKSIEFTMTASSQAWAQLNFPDPMNLSKADSYKNLTLRIKLIEPSTDPSSVAIYLLSAMPPGNFSYDLTGRLNSTGVWSNLTIPLGSAWTSGSADADWGNITSLRAEFTWSASSNMTLLIDGLFFHGLFKPAIETQNAALISYPLDAFMQYTIQWITMGSLLYLMAKVLKVQTFWKPLLVVAGFVLVTLVIQTVINALLLYAHPEFLVPLKMLGGVPGETQRAYIEVFGSITFVWLWVERAMLIWTIVLGATALRTAFELSWTKSIIVATLASVISLLAFRFLTYGTMWL